MQGKCMMCGKTFTIEQFEEDPDDFLSLGNSKKPSTSICTLCQARLQKEAKDKDKDLKPM